MNPFERSVLCGILMLSRDQLLDQLICAENARAIARKKFEAACEQRAAGLASLKVVNEALSEYVEATMACHDIRDILRKR